MRKLMLLFLCVAFVGTVNSQVKFGVKGGMNFSDYDAIEISGSSDDFWDSRTSWNAGLFVQFNFLGMAIQPELLYSEKGTKGFKMSYIDLPLSLRVNLFNIEGVVKPFIIGGPFVSYAIDGDYDGENDDLGDFEYKKLDYGAGVGVGCDLFNFLQLTTRYDWGFGKLGDDEHFKKSKSSVFSVSLGIYF